LIKSKEWDGSHFSSPSITLGVKRLLLVCPSVDRQDGHEPCTQQGFSRFTLVFLSFYNQIQPAELIRVFQGYRLPLDFSFGVSVRTSIPATSFNVTIKSLKLAWWLLTAAFADFVRAKRDYEIEHPP